MSKGRNKDRLLIPEAHLVEAFRNRTNTLDAISELIDNAVDARARNFKLTIDAHEVEAIDDGIGASDINLFFGFGYSASKASKKSIGRFGIGAKEATLHFGSVVLVRSTHRGKTRQYMVDWDKVQRNGWPRAHSGAWTTSTTPQAGTKILISQLARGRPRLYPEFFKRLAHRYRLSLAAGMNIEIWNDGVRCALSADIDVLGNWKTEQEMRGSAAGHGFALRYCDLKEYDPHLSGVHIAYGNRFVEHVKKLDGKTLPSLFYAEVVLDHSWKELLSPNKTTIARYRDELLESLHTLLHDWIIELEKHSDEARVEKLNVFLTRATAEIFTFSGKGSGSKRGPREMPIGGKGEGRGDGPSEGQNTISEAVPDDQGSGSKKSHRRPPSGLFFKRDDQLGKFPFQIFMDQRENRLTVKLNGSIPAIDLAYRVPYKISALWPLITTAFASWCRAYVKNLDVTLPGFLDELNSKGYPINIEVPEDIESYVISWMMRQQPLHSVKELEEKAS